MAAKKVTEKELLRVFRVWSNRLNLAHWVFEIDLEAELEDRNAEICISEDYDHGFVRFDVDWPTWSAKKLNEVCAHELYHAHLHGLIEAALIGEDGFSTHAWHLYKKRLVHELEHCVDTLAINAVKNLGPA